MMPAPWCAALLLLLCVCGRASLDVYPSPSGTPPSADYSATVGGFPAFVYFTSRQLMQPVAPGDNVPTLNGRNTSFLGFATSGPVTVEVTVTSSALVSAAQLYPLRAASLLPPLSVVGKVITVQLDGPRQVCIVVNGVTDAPLCIFADPPETYVPSPDSPGVIFFGPGTVDAGIISVGAGQTVYLAPGAHVFGRVELSGDSSACSGEGKGVAIRGRGVLDGHNFTIDANGPSLVSLNCVFALVEGVTLLNSPKYQLDAGYPYTTVNWTKAIAWGYSTDGFTGGSQSLVEHSFLKVNDDSLKPFGTGFLVSDVVIWQMENGCAVMGSWNLNQDTGFVTARRLDIIRHERNYGIYNPDALLCFVHGGSGHLSNYLFDDIRVDMAGWAAIQVFVALNPWAHPVGGVPGSISTVIVRNFSSSTPFLNPLPVQLQGFGESSTITAVTLDAVFFNALAASPVDVNISGNPAFADPPGFCTNCTRAVVGDDWTQQQKCSMATSWCRTGEDGVSAAGLEPDLVWEYRAPYQMCSTPTLQPELGLIFAGSYDFNMYALSAASGEVAWNFSTKNQIYSQAALADGGATLIFSDYDFGHYKLNASSGALVWRFELDGVSFSSPAVAPDGASFTSTLVGTHFCINGDGSLRWNASTDGGQIMGSPALSLDGRVVYMPSGGGLVARDALSGEVLWTSPAGNANDRPAVGPDGSIFFTNDKLYKLAPNGTQLWGCDSGVGGMGHPALSADASVVFTGSACGSSPCPGQAFGIDAASGALLWNTTVSDGAFFAAPGYNAGDDTVLFPNFDNNFYLLNGSTGQKIWTYGAGSRLESGVLVLPDGVFVAGGTDNNVYALKSVSGSATVRSKGAQSSTIINN